VADATSQAVAYTYFREEENEARLAKVLSYDEAQRIAEDIAKLPELLGRKREEYARLRRRRSSSSRLPDQARRTSLQRQR